MPGILFAEPRLATIYDALHPDRSDLDPFLAIIDELAPASVLDLGCGTGTLACLLANRGTDVIGVDPAGPSIDVASGKPGAERVRWFVGTAAALPDVAVDLVTMTGNVGEHLDDGEWLATLRACRAALRPGGHLVFGSRDPSGEAWLRWTRASTFERADIPGVGVVEHWLDITGSGPRHFSFRWTFVFHADGAVFDWDATFHVRSRAELVDALQASGFDVADVNDDHFIFTARRRDAP